jgi:GT2 family glycosyltransferase
MTVVKNELPLVGIVIINYNGETFVRHCLEELLKVDYKNAEVVFLDNDSTDESVALVERHFPDVLIHQTGHNGGYAGGAEIAVNLAEERNWDYLLVMNPDIVFEQDYVQKVVQKMEDDYRIGAIIGKLNQYKFNKKEKTDVIDSAGLLMYKDRRVVDRGQAQKDEGQFDKEEQVFGITGAAPMYRVAALGDIKVFGEVFDQDFFMYKEDVDVSWRLNLYGWRNWYLPQARAYHARGTGIYKRDSYKEVAKERKKLSKFQKSHSFRNQHFIQFKNEIPSNALANIFPILLKEAALIGFMLIREQFLIKSLFEFIIKIPKMYKKRRVIMKNKRVTAKRMRKILRLGHN